jgi:hypothetical protein
MTPQDQFASAPKTDRAGLSVKPVPLRVKARGGRGDGADRKAAPSRPVAHAVAQERTR